MEAEHEPDARRSRPGHPRQGADATFSRLTTLVTPSVSRAMRCARSRSVADVTLPVSVTTACCVSTSMARPLTSASRKYCDWILVVIQESSIPDAMRSVESCAADGRGAAAVALPTAILSRTSRTPSVLRARVTA